MTIFSATNVDKVQLSSIAFSVFSCAAFYWYWSVVFITGRLGCIRAPIVSSSSSAAAISAQKYRQTDSKLERETSSREDWEETATGRRLLDQVARNSATTTTLLFAVTTAGMLGVERGPFHRTQSLRSAAAAVWKSAAESLPMQIHPHSTCPPGNKTYPLTPTLH